MDQVMAALYLSRLSLGRRPRRPSYPKYATCATGVVATRFSFQDEGFERGEGIVTLQHLPQYKYSLARPM